MINRTNYKEKRIKELTKTKVHIQQKNKNFKQDNKTLRM